MASTTQVGVSQGPTVAVDTMVFPRVAYFPLSGPEVGDWKAIAAPNADPLQVSGSTLAGTVASARVLLVGPSENRTDDLGVGLLLYHPDGTTEQVTLSQIPTGDASAAFSSAVECPTAASCPASSPGCRRAAS